MLRVSVGNRQNWLDDAIDLAVMVGVCVLILVGFATSYRTLLELAVLAGGYPRWLAPAVPLSFDLGIVVLSLKVAQAAREGRHSPVLRLLVMALSGATVVANASAVPGVAARLLHAVPPAMFVVCFESVIMTARRRALLARGAWPAPMPRQHPLRWLLSPHATWCYWRATVLGLTDPAGHAASQGSADTRLRGSGDPISADVGQLRAGSAGQVDPKLVLIAAQLRDQRHMAAPALRSLLAAEGHELSLRSVQRLKATVLKELDA